jgi:hypothetical protein
MSARTQLDSMFMRNCKDHDMIGLNRVMNEVHCRCNVSDYSFKIVWRMQTEHQGVEESMALEM